MYIGNPNERDYMKKALIVGSKAEGINLCENNLRARGFTDFIKINSTDIEQVRKVLEQSRNDIETVSIHGTEYTVRDATAILDEMDRLMSAIHPTHA
jgi:pyruvate/2-oxoglutarate dehydrogenase complex dihydrolipoamide acyltransferase (E2) component